MSAALLHLQQRVMNLEASHSSYLLQLQTRIIELEQKVAALEERLGSATTDGSHSMRFSDYPGSG